MYHASQLRPTRGLACPLAAPADQPTPETRTRARGAIRRGAAATEARPLLRVVAAVAGLALSWGAFQVTHTLRASHDNTPISSSSRAPNDALTVPARGAARPFPADWINVRTTPHKFAQSVWPTRAGLISRDPAADPGRP
jgi:hypothetical protein